MGGFCLEAELARGRSVTNGVNPSYIRKEKYRPATTPAAPMSRSGYPPWILKRGGVESSGRRLISSIGKTKRIAFFFCKKKIFSKF